MPRNTGYELQKTATDIVSIPLCGIPEAGREAIRRIGMVFQSATNGVSVVVQEGGNIVRTIIETPKAIWDALGTKCR